MNPYARKSFNSDDAPRYGGMAGDYDVMVVGGGILGTAISYFASCLGKSVCVAEQEDVVAGHASGRNTGKVHAPYLYDPEKKARFARAAFHGYGMWAEYAKVKGLPFKQDGVIEVALDIRGTRVLEKYRSWAVRNGLDESGVRLLDGRQAKGLEPEIRCEAALHVTRDASADYAAFTRALMQDSVAAGTKFLAGSKVTGMKHDGTKWVVTMNREQEVGAKFLVNAAGGAAMDIAHGMELAEGMTDVHFRGEYWKAPAKYETLTKTSVYSVPEFPEYPFLDPHWIVRADGTCEVGPNAVPVFSPYGYDAASNIKEFVPKVLEMLGSGARKAIFDRHFQELAISEVHSSVSKSAMIERVRRFLPGIEPDGFSERGTAGIRSSVIGRDGKFVPDVMLIHDDHSYHILNYNSPGATGALPFAACIVHELGRSGLVPGLEGGRCGMWDFADIVAKAGW